MFIQNKKIIIFALALVSLCVGLSSCTNCSTSHEITEKVSIEETEPEWESLGTVTAKTRNYSNSIFDWDMRTGTLYTKNIGGQVYYKFKFNSDSDKNEYTVFKYSGEYKYNATFSVSDGIYNPQYYLNVPSW